jgi:4-amino-4-deoxy-L-arabinose transferase
MDQKHQNRYLILTGIACACAFLTKGFVAFVIVGLVIGPFLIWQRDWKKIFTMLPWPIVALATISIPWSIAIHLHEPDFWHYFFVVEHLHRFASGDAQHTEPIWYYIPVLLESTIPWIFIAPFVIRGLLENKTPLLRFAACWLIVPFLFFTASDGKLGTYLIPLFPAVIIMIVLGIEQNFQNKKHTGIQTGILLFAALIAIASIVICFIPVDVFLKRIDFNCNPALLKLSVASAGILWFLLASVAGLGKSIKPTARIILIAIGSTIFLTTIHIASSHLIVKKKMPVQFLTNNLDQITHASMIASDSYLAPAIAWVACRTDINILNSPGELQYGINTENSTNRLMNFEMFTRAVNSNKNGNIVLILKENTFKDYSQSLPKPTNTYTGNGFICAVFSANNTSHR